MQDRIPLGTYPKWAGRLIRWVLNHRLPTRVTIAFRGRGKDRLGERTRYGLTVRSASHVALYLVYTHPRPRQDRREPLPLTPGYPLPMNRQFLMEDAYKPAGDDFCSIEHTER